MCSMSTAVPPFYISFLLSPLAANLAEVVTAVRMASKKTAKTTNVALMTLQGACIMNNTFVLGIFMCLSWVKSLAWAFFAETLAILLVQLLVVGLTFKKSVGRPSNPSREERHYDERHYTMPLQLYRAFRTDSAGFVFSAHGSGRGASTGALPALPVPRGWVDKNGV